ncbi:helix-turn-helix transcriptional regulator [Mycobacterium sp. CVI_P3]|uniref:Helix-turn-helix transcriptional regulator n=1 Tax=Mycobacterium pinniadriaticum TaxID=2994102 RepID=A0ABT3SH63_9MYCO|nr:helix-turn-helix transcriptional regulator [Mycobacterium pinniadriaticum]MCX2932302.1 helix-turn-helix transcriptional regulator [Mycobacterium pinniadriaticum]MCX2938841.1 helix-turn-helix transcriptional regulator [Mycobacterium pinniadriaticum]
MADIAVLELRISIDFVQYPIVQLLIQRGAIFMTPEQTVKLINLLKEKRGELGLSVNEVARRADVDPGTVWRIEQGMIAKPRVESLIAMGGVLGINAMELFTTVGWLTADDLPSLGTYLSAKFTDLPDAVTRHIEHHVAKILHAYEHSTGGRHTSTEPENCPWCKDHLADRSHSSKEH